MFFKMYWPGRIGEAEFVLPAAAMAAKSDGADDDQSREVDLDEVEVSSCAQEGAVSEHDPLQTDETAMTAPTALEIQSHAARSDDSTPGLAPPVLEIQSHITRPHVEILSGQSLNSVQDLFTPTKSASSGRSRRGTPPQHGFPDEEMDPARSPLLSEALFPQPSRGGQCEAKAWVFEGRTSLG